MPGRRGFTKADLGHGNVEVTRLGYTLRQTIGAKQTTIDKLN